MPQVETRERETQKPEHYPYIIHSYPRAPVYRLSGSEHAQPGDIAYCGWRKKVPHVSLPHGSETCVVCIELMRRAEHP